MAVRGFPRLVDLCCGLGAAAEGYRRAGWNVHGVDVIPQPYYRGDSFELGEALDFLGMWMARGGLPFDAIHASPPCQAYSCATPVSRRGEHPDLVDAIRTALEGTGLPWVMENVPGSPVRGQLLLCGTMFDLRVQRHRLFEANWSLPLAPADCWHAGQTLGYGSSRGRRGARSGREYSDAMGVTWGPGDSSGGKGPSLGTAGVEGFPPAYAEFVGRSLRGLVA